MAADFGFAPKDWKRGPTVGPLETAPASAFALKNCNCSCMELKNQHAAVGIGLKKIDFHAYFLDSINLLRHNQNYERWLHGPGTMA
jgi:hypothetical protein